MGRAILEKLTPITAEEQRILQGESFIDRSLYMNGDRDIIEGKKLLGPGQPIAVRPHTRFIDFPMHTHDYVEMVYMCCGTTTHMLGDREVQLREGELLLLGQNTHQKILKAGKDDIAVNFIIRPEFFEQTLPYLGTEQTPLRRFLIDSLCGGLGRYLYFQVADVLPVQNLMENLLYHLLCEAPCRQGIDSMTMGLLFLQLSDRSDRLQTATQEETAVVRLLRYVEENYRAGSLSEAAMLMHYDLSWLSRQIKRSTGKTYTELVQEKRLTRAAWMLENTRSRVDQIAEAVGYENISYFHRVFYARFGMTPKQYRSCK
ncbi:MAG: helix-turn-helix domain-containing protein [Oscillospiraceae bacterium]|nr:helix-turn-helix domain-containing protein [Oscillospiraceae bacterium]